jgi:ribosomal protein L37AE/L43A
MAMHCTACRKRTHKVTRTADNTWLCPACHTPAPSVKTKDAAPAAVKFKGVLVAVFKIGARPDYSRN